MAKRTMVADIDGPVLLSIGASIPENGADIFIEAMRRTHLRGWQVLIVDAGPEEGRIRGMVGPHEKGAVVFHQPVSSGAEAIAVTPQSGGDSMPAVLIEAGMMGIPSVAMAVEGIVDIILKGHTDKVMPLDDPDAIAESATDDFEARDRLRSQASEHCRQRFETGLVAQRWLAVLDHARAPS